MHPFIAGPYDIQRRMKNWQWSYKGPWCELLDPEQNIGSKFGLHVFEPKKYDSTYLSYK